MPNTDLRAKFLAVVQAYASDNDDLELIEQSGDRIADYHRHVAWMDRNAELWQLRMDPPEFRTYFTEQDRVRRNLHELAISSTARLDRMADQAGLPLVFGGDTKDRYAVASFAGDFTAACYEHGRSRVGLPLGRTVTTQLKKPAPAIESAAPTTTHRSLFDIVQPEPAQTEGPEL